MYRDINVTENGTFSRITDITLVPGDSNAYKICYKTSYDLENVEFKITAIRSDGKIINDIGECEGQTAYCVLSNSVYAVPGELMLRLTLITEDTVLTQKELIMMVAEDFSGSGESATNEVSFADKLIQRMQNLLSAFYEKVKLLIPDISGKADKEQSGGGFIGGRNAKVGDNNDNPGASLGADSYACWGIAGGAQSRTNGGAGLGAYTYSYDGGSAGLGATTSNGFAGGANAKTIYENGNAMDAVQLGTGVNNEEKSLQVYEYKLLKSNGLIPPERMYMDVKDQTSNGSITLELGNGQEHRFYYGAQSGSTMTITFPSQIPEGYISTLAFTNGSNSWTLVYSESIKWSGDDIVNHVLLPQLNTRYNIMFWYDGFCLNAVARGVSLV